MVLLLLLMGGHANAQLEKVVQQFLGNDSATSVNTPKSNDSVRLKQMAEALDSARLSEASLRMEMELLKMKTNGADSLNRALQKQRIDSLRKVTPGVPVVVDGDTLFYLYAKRGGLSPQERAQVTASKIEELGKKFNLRPDSVYMDSTDIVTDLMYGNKVIISFTDQDGLWANCSRSQLAAKERLVIVQKLQQLQETHGAWQMGKRILYFI
jgi:hypothetical protein